ncbi:MAG: hypothetical protein ACRCXZ_00550 [Patescibacteria group bacterium]
MTPLIILILAIIISFISFYLLAFTLNRAVIDYYNELRISPEFGTIQQGAIEGINPNQNNLIPPISTPGASRTSSGKVLIGSVNKKFDFVNKTPLKAFSNAYDRTIFALEEQHWEDWLDAIEKIYKMLRKDFTGTIKKFMTFLLNLSKPLPKDDLESRMEKINQQKQQLEVDKMIDRLQDGDSKDQVFIDQPQTKQLPQTITANQSIGKASIPSQKITIIKPKILSEEIDLNTEEVDIDVEFTEFQKIEQRILKKLKDIGIGNFDLWLDLAELYIKNDENDKAKSIYRYIAKNGDNKSKQKAVNGLIGLDL